MEKKFTIQISPKTIFNFIFLILIIIAFFVLKDLVLVFLTSVVIATFINLLLEKIENLKFFIYLQKVSTRNNIVKFFNNRAFKIIFLYIIASGVLGVLFYVFVPVFKTELGHFLSFLSQKFPQENISKITEALKETKSTLLKVSENDFNGIFESTKKISFSNQFFPFILNIFGGIFNFILLLVFSFYLSTNKDGIKNFFKIVFPKEKINYIVSFWERVEWRVARWVQGQFILSFLMGSLTLMGLLILGVKYALLLALIAALFELIPFGFALATLTAVIFSFLDGGLSLAISVAILYLILQYFETYLLQPLVIKKVTNVPSLIVILSILIGAKLAGFWGIILGVPVSVVVLEYLNDLELKKKEE